MQRNAFHTFCKEKPIVTITLMTITSVSSLSLLISCIVKSSSFNCYLIHYLTLDSSKIFSKSIELWRIFTPYFVCNSFWQQIYFIFILFFVGNYLERTLGSGRLVLLLFLSMLFISFCTIILNAFFGQIPGIKTVSYFADQWHDNAQVGASSLVILYYIYQYRIERNKNTLCCCCDIPTWLFLLMIVIMCQLMLYLPWYGLCYTGSSVICAFSIPIRLFIPKQNLNSNIELQQGSPQTIMQTTDQTQGNQIYEPVTLNNEQEMQKKSTSNVFKGKGRKL